MLKTLTKGTFEYKGRKVEARRTFDYKTGKAKYWIGMVEGEGGYPVAGVSAEDFEKNFVLSVDAFEDKPVEE